MSNKLLSSRFWALLAVILITFLLFSPTLDHELVFWDDDAFLTENTLVRSGNWPHVYEIFRSLTCGTYVPLTILSFSLEYRYFGFNPFIYHLHSLFLHVMNTGLIFVLGSLMGLGLKAAFFSALIFGIHPVHVESVAWITERKTLLYAFFYLITLISYWKFLDTGKRRFYILSLLAGLGSILSKAMALSLPFNILLLDMFKGRKMNRAALFEKAPFFLYIIPLAWLSYQGHMRIPGAGSLIQSLLIWVWSCAFYLRQFFFPQYLTPLYELPVPVSILNFDYALGFLILFAAVVLLKKVRNRWFLFAISFYFFSMFFLFRFDNLKDINIVADRFMYLPCLGLCFLLGDVLARVLRLVRRGGLSTKIMVFTALIALIFSIAWKTRIQIGYWKNSLIFWNHVISRAPHHPLGYNNRGVVYLRQGQMQAALADFQMAIDMAPGYYKARFNRGVVFEQDGLFEQAVREYSKAIDLNPDYLKAYVNRGNGLIQLRDYGAALSDFDIVISKDPNHAPAYLNRGIVYFYQDDHLRALQDLTRAVFLNPDFFEAYLARAGIYTLSHHYLLAVEDYTRAMHLKPSDCEIYQSRARVFSHMGLHGQALRDLSKAEKCGVNPDPLLVNQIQQEMKIPTPGEP